MKPLTITDKRKQENISRKLAEIQFGTFFSGSITSNGVSHRKGIFLITRLGVCSIDNPNNDFNWACGDFPTDATVEDFVDLNVELIIHDEEIPY